MASRLAEPGPTAFFRVAPDLESCEHPLSAILSLAWKSFPLADEVSPITEDTVDDAVPFFIETSIRDDDFHQHMQSLTDLSALELLQEERGFREIRGQIKRTSFRRCSEICECHPKEQS